MEPQRQQYQGPNRRHSPQPYEGEERRLAEPAVFEEPTGSPDIGNPDVSAQEGVDEERESLDVEQEGSDVEREGTTRRQANYDDTQ